MDLYEILPLKYARFLPPLVLLSPCIFHEDFQGPPEPTLKEPGAFPKVMHIHQCTWKLLRGTEGRPECKQALILHHPARQQLPGPPTLHPHVERRVPLLFVLTVRGKTQQKLHQGKIMAWPVEFDTEHFALVLPVHSALQLLLFFFFL